MEKKREIKPEGFIQKLFACCIEKNNGEFEIESEENNKDFFMKDKSKMVFENELAIFPNNMIRPEEKNKIKFTKDGIIEYIKTLQDLVFPVVYDDKSVKISKRNYSDINEKLPVIRCEITKHKLYFTDVPSIKQMVEALTNPEMRKKWDTNLKDYKILYKIKNDSEVVKTVANKQLSIIPEKEIYDKRVGIFENNIYYLFSSSVPDEIYPSYSYDRAKNYLCIMVIKEDDDNFYFDCFNQIDININVPIEFIEANLVNKVNSFFDKYFEFLNILK